jgi:phospholipase/carboxylesterase
VWFHNDGGNEDDLEPVMKAMSPQNYCGLALRGNHRFKHPEAYGWNQSEVSFGKVSLASLVNVTARRLRKAFHIHSERIFVAGSGTGADIAMQLLLTHPDWFAGAVLMDPPCDLAGETAVESGGLRGKHVLQTVSRQSPNAQLARNVEMVRLLRTCGADIDVRMTDSELDVFSSDVRFVDHWLISRITSKATLNS